MNNNSARRASVILGVFMFVVLVAGAIIPLITRGTNITSTGTEPTATIAPTLPPPITDLSTVTFDKVYLHPTGMFAIAQPTGWNASQPTSSSGIAQINMINSTQLSVIDAFVENAGTAITAEDLSARFTAESIRQTWSNFSSALETNRELVNDQLVMDFRTDLRGQQFVARQIAWTDGEWIYTVRVVVPENAVDTLRYLLGALVPNGITPFKQFSTTPFNWNAYYDPVTSAIIRYPAEWAITDSAPGRPTSISSANGVNLRTETIAGASVADEAAARQWVENERPGARVLSAAPVTRNGVAGFSVTYTYTDVEGTPFSGAAVLLNTGSALYVAKLTFPAADVDLNTIDTTPDTVEAEATPELPGLLAPEATTNSDVYLNLAMVMETFQVLSPLNLSVDSLPPATPTPLPTVPPPTVEVTPEAAATEAAAPEATEAAAEATAEASAEAPAEAPTAEVTPEATASS